MTEGGMSALLRTTSGSRISMAWIAATLFTVSCSSGPEGGRGARTPDELGGTGAAVLVESQDSVVGGVAQLCRREFEPEDAAGFVHDWFVIVTSLQRSVDANAIRQVRRDPDGRGFLERTEDLRCALRVLAPYGESTDSRIAGFARSAAAVVSAGIDAEDRAADVFRSMDRPEGDSLDDLARRWSELRPSTRGLSERAASLTETVVPLLRADGRATFGPGKLRISEEGREVALRPRGRLTDLTIMVELGIDPDLPLSTAARKVVKWLYHSHDLTFEENP
jgi:hypothetical protein